MLTISMNTLHLDGSPAESDIEVSSQVAQNGMGNPDVHMVKFVHKRDDRIEDAFFVSREDLITMVGML